MKLGIMQPYFLPYIGYYQLINLVDKFVVYDNIKYTKKGWINRNRIVINGKDDYITLPLESASDNLNINQRYLSRSFFLEKQKILRRVRENYQKATFYQEVYNLTEEILSFNDPNLFEFILNSLRLVCQYLKINTTFVVSSTLPIDHALRGGDKVRAICQYMQSEHYINPIGGIQLYSQEEFKKYNISLQFISSNTIFYSQFSKEFIPNLSILDVMMHNSKETITQFLNREYKLI